MRSMLISFCLGLFTLAAFSQSNQGTITGTLSDPTGAVVPSAEINVKNVDTGIVYRGGTSSTGNYVIPVPAGNYEITVSVTGFKKFVQKNVQVIVATDTRKDVVLEVGQATDVVTVTDTAPLLKTESGEMSHRVTVEDADTLPVLTIAGGTWNGATALGNIRNPLAISQLLPGVTFSNDNTLVVNGLPSNSESIRVEGQDSTGNIWKVLQQSSQGGVDAIQEVSIQTSNFAAEFGQVGGGYFNYNMKSGTNQFHGSGYDYFVNEAFNAGLPFTNAGLTNSLKSGEHVRNSVRRNDYGFTIGGPIKIPKVYNGENRSFFFFNFEQFRENQRIGNGLATVPTAAYRAGDYGTSGCFTFVNATSTCTLTPALTIGGVNAQDTAGQTLTYGEVFDPATTRLVNGAQVRTPFPNQQIPLTRMDPVAVAIQNMLPKPNAPGLVNNYQIPSYTNFQHTTNYSFKLDHSISPTRKVSGYFSHLSTIPLGANGFTQPFTSALYRPFYNYQIRLNYDESIRPTLLLHVGLGYFDDKQLTLSPTFDQTTLGLKGYFDTQLFPTMGAQVVPFTNIGGGNGISLGGSFNAQIWEQKPTANTSLTWVKQNHTYKFGGEYTGEGYPEHSQWRANGSFTFSNAETSDPWQNLQPLNYANGSGFAYASFMLGLPDQIQISPQTGTRLGNHLMGFFMQDSWKVSRKLTLDYGLRYDFQTYLQESFGRMLSASFTALNPTVGRPGAVIYEGYGGGRCNCAFSHNYPWAFGPRVGLAYQINPKTVLRTGAGVSYGVMNTPAGISYSVADFYSYNAPGYGISPVTNGLAAGNPYPNVQFPNFDAGKFPTRTSAGLPPQSPFNYFDNQARPSRILQWSFGLQREVAKDLVAEATYVGNTGAWIQSVGLAQLASNSLTPDLLAQHGLSLANPADRSLLTGLLSSPAAIARGFGPAYAGMPLTQTVVQTLRPIPQWAGNVNPYLGPALGRTWYDSLQVKVTKRYSHGLSMQGSYTWAKGLTIDGATDTNFFVSGISPIKDLYNYQQNKQLNQLVRPQVLIISGTYVTPGFRGDNLAMKVASNVVKDWQIGALVQYQSGALIQSPTSNNQLLAQLGRGGAAPSSNPWNYVPGANPLLVDPNCHCFNPQSAQVLNAAAWAEAPPGTWGVSAPYYNNYRWQRQPAESMSMGRNFRMGKEGKYNLNIRAEFQNVFNRVFLSAPTATNPVAAVTTVGGVNNGGFGTIATINGVGARPRSGQMVARFTF